MSEILQEIIPTVISVLVTGGVGSIFYFRLNKKLKESEVKAAELENKSKEIENSASINGEWERISNKLTSEREELVNEMHNQSETIKELQDRIEKANSSKEQAWESYSASRIECAKKDRLISELNWYRCEINGCPYRKPPRKFGDFDFPENAVINTDDIKNDEN